MNNNESTVLTDEQIEDIATTAENAVPEEVTDMRDLKETVQVNTDAELESANVEIENIAREIEDFDPEKFDELTEAGDRVGEKFSKMYDELNMNDDEILQFMDTLSKYSEDDSYPLYKNLPEPMKKMIRDLAMQNGVPASQWNKLASVIMDEFLATSGVEQNLIDLQEALDEALKIPSVVDMYSEHTRDVMNNIIPKTIENIKDEYPDKAENLARVNQAFEDAYSFTVAKREYESKATIRKAVRRYETEFKKILSDFNFKNEKSNFKMNDVFEVPKTLIGVLMDTPQAAYMMHEEDGTLDKLPDQYKRLLELEITEDDIEKFSIMICKSSENRDPRDVVDGSYMYYMMRNIIALQYTNEAKTEFAAELINNICDAIIFIRNKEAEFYEQNSKPKRKQKSNK